jgi:hypothetical protein
MKPRVRTLALRDQAAWIKFHFPAFVCSVSGNELISRGVLQPTPLSQSYRIVGLYVAGRRPRVFVPGGQLRRRDPNEPIPHMYSDDEPCLYYPIASEWRSDMKIATSIFGWLTLWLTYYEIWRATGEWHGGGIEHGEEGKEDDAYIK